MSYPKLISVHSVRVVIERPSPTQGDPQMEKRRLRYVPSVLIQRRESSFSDVPRQVTTVDIRNREASEGYKLAHYGGHLRTAISQIEGLDIYANKESRDGSSREMNRSKDTDHDSESIPNETIPIRTSVPQDRIPAGLTTFEQLKVRFMKRHQVKSEVKSGKRVGFYRIILDIGRGNFSKVKLANHTLLNTSVAVKVIDRTKFNAKTRRLLSQELANMERLDHPHIIQVFEVHELLQRCYLVMEYAPAGELHSYLKRNGRMDNRSAKNISAQILSALKHMHDRGVIHRDLKAENVLFFSPHLVKVGDFGFSRLCAIDQPLTTFCGSPSYAAPELFVGKSYIGPAVDLWAFGVLLFYMVVGALPFHGESVQVIKKSVLEGEYIIPAFIDRDCKQLIDGLICKSVERRFGVDQVQQSTWYDEENWTDMTRQSHPGSDHLGDHDVRSILHKWWDIEDWELDSALKDGPRNSLTGIYRITRAYGKMFTAECPSAGFKKKVSRKKSKRQEDENALEEDSKRKNRKQFAAQEEELTTVDLRDKNVLKENGEKSADRRSKVCTIS